MENYISVDLSLSTNNTDLDNYPREEDHHCREDDATLFEAVGHGKDRHADDGVGQCYY